MNAWLIGATVLVLGLVPCAVVMVRGSVVEALVGLQMAGVLQTIAARKRNASAVWSFIVFSSSGSCSPVFLGIFRMLFSGISDSAGWITGP